MAHSCMLVIAREADAAVADLCARAPGYVRHVRPSDLSRRGWRYVAGRPDAACAVAEGEVVHSSDVAAVLCRVPAIAPADLPHIQSADRGYVAAEMQAFLLAWLAQFRGLRFNAPTPGSLCGPAWDALRWRQVAARTGLPVAQASGASASAHVTVVGAQAFGTKDPLLAAHARQLAAAAELAILGVHFVLEHDAWRFAGADPCPALGAEGAAALLRIARSRNGGQRWAA
jgi:hypothetical protein